MKDGSGSGFFPGSESGKEKFIDPDPVCPERLYPGDALNIAVNNLLTLLTYCRTVHL